MAVLQAPQNTWLPSTSSKKIIKASVENITNNGRLQKKKNTQHFKITNKNLVASLTDDNFNFTQRINRKHIYTRKKLTINTVCNFYIRFMKRQKDTSVLYGRWHQCFKVNESILEYCQHLQILVLCFHGVHQVNLTYITYPHSKSVLMILYIH